MTTYLPHKFTTAEEFLDYTHGGNATVTLTSLKTDKYFTYTLTRSPWSCPGETSYFVWYMGKNKKRSYVGMINPKRYFRFTKRSMPRYYITSAAFVWIWRFITNMKRLPTTAALYRFNECGRCGKKLTTPESIKKGFGPCCIKLLGKEKENGG